jgi:uncharacterized membrane protein YgcG
MNWRGIFYGIAGLLCFASLGIAIWTMEHVVADAQEATSTTTPPEAPPAKPPVTADRVITADLYESHASILAALGRNGEWEFSEVPLHEVVTFVRTASQVDVVIDLGALGDMGVPTDTPITCDLKDISLRSFFGIILGDLDLTLEIHDGGLWITSIEEAKSRLSMRTYPVSDLIRVREDYGESAYDYDSLIEAIMGFLRPELWDEVGGPGAIDGIYGTLVVSQVGDVHEELTQFLTALRLVVRRYEENPDGPGLPVFVGGSEARARITGALDSRMSIEVKDAPLSDVAEFLSDSAGIPIVIDTSTLDDYGIASDSPVTAHIDQLPLRFALRRLLDPLGLTWTIRNEVLAITTLEANEGQLLTCIYSVYDLVAPHAEAQVEELDFDSLIEVISRTIEPSTWEEVGGMGTINSLVGPPALVISQSESVHGQLRELIHQLRRAKRLERAQTDLPAKAAIATRLTIRTYQMQLGHDANDVLVLADKFFGKDIFQGDGVVVEVLSNGIVVRHHIRGHRRIEAMLTELGVWHSPSFGKSGGWGYGGGGGGGGGFSGGASVGGSSGGKAANPMNGGGGFF